MLGGSGGRKERLSLEAPTPRAFFGERSRVRRKLEKQRGVDGGRGVGNRARPSGYTWLRLIV